MTTAVRCPNCRAPLVRSRRKGVVERALLAPLPFLRPLRCPRCGFRGLRMSGAPERRVLLFLAVLLAAGLLLLQLLWHVRTRAPEHPGGGYQPRDLERQRYLEERRER